MDPPLQAAAPPEAERDAAAGPAPPACYLIVHSVAKKHNGAFPGGGRGARPSSFFRRRRRLPFPSHPAHPHRLAPDSEPRPSTLPRSRTPPTFPQWAPSPAAPPPLASPRSSSSARLIFLAIPPSSPRPAPHPHNEPPHATSEPPPGPPNGPPLHRRAQLQLVRLPRRLGPRHFQALPLPRRRAPPRRPRFLSPALRPSSAAHAPPLSTIFEARLLSTHSEKRTTHLLHPLPPPPYPPPGYPPGPRLRPLQERPPPRRRDRRPGPPHRPPFGLLRPNRVHTGQRGERPLPRTSRGLRRLRVHPPTRPGDGVAERGDGGRDCFAPVHELGALPGAPPGREQVRAPACLESAARRLCASLGVCCGPRCACAVRQRDRDGPPRVRGVVQVRGCGEAAPDGAQGGRGERGGPGGDPSQARRGPPRARPAARSRSRSLLHAWGPAVLRGVFFFFSLTQSGDGGGSAGAGGRRRRQSGRRTRRTARASGVGCGATQKKKGENMMGGGWGRRRRHSSLPE